MRQEHRPERLRGPSRPKKFGVSPV